MNSPDFLPTLYIIVVYHPPVSGALRRQAGFAFGYSVRLVSPVGASVRKPTQPVAKSRSRIPTASEAENSISSGIHPFHILSPLCKSNTPCLSCRAVSSGATFVFLSNTLFFKKLIYAFTSFLRFKEKCLFLFRRCPFRLRSPLFAFLSYSWFFTICFLCISDFLDSFYFYFLQIQCCES